LRAGCELLLRAGNQIEFTTFEDAIVKEKNVNQDLMRMAEILAM
jgi:hypothetical protein